MFLFFLMVAIAVLLILPPSFTTAIQRVGHRGIAALMRFGKVALAIILSMVLVPLAACDKVERKPDPVATAAPTPVDGNQVEENIGGPCGDGSVLKPGEHCK